MSCHPALRHRGFHPTGAVSVFGAAMTTGKLRGLALTPQEELRAYDGYSREQAAKVNPLLVTHEQALDAFNELARLEGILPALESAHAVAAVRALSSELGPGAVIVVNLSGRGDKDLATVLVERI